MTTIIEVIKKAIRDIDPTIDISNASTLMDLLITPGSLMMEPVLKQISFLVRNQSMSDPRLIEPTELDALMANFLQYRNNGARSTGMVEVFYAAPINLDVPYGTKFTDILGNEYVTTQAMYVSADTMANNTWLYPYYSSGPLAVESINIAQLTEIGPNQITSTALLPAPARVTNPTGFSGNVPKESNVKFFARALDSVITRSLGSAAGIENTLVTLYPTIQDISVKGMGDAEMLRDLVLSGIAVYPYKTVIDFYGKVSGLVDLPHPESLAYWNVFWDDPTTSGIQPDLPSLEELAIDELTTTQYAGMYKFNDAAYTKFNTSIIMEEHFADESLAAHWRTSDAKHALGVSASSSEFAIEQRGAGNKLRLGYRTTDTDVPTRPIKVDVQFMLNVLNFLKISATMAPEVSAAQPHADRFADIYAVQRFVDENTIS